MDRLEGPRRGPTPQREAFLTKTLPPLPAYEIRNGSDFGPISPQKGPFLEPFLRNPQKIPRWQVFSENFQIGNFPKNPSLQ